MTFVVIGALRVNSLVCLDLGSVHHLMLVNICMKFQGFFKLQSRYNHITISTIFSFKGP